jgi:putative DNA primase/helicase
MLTAASPGTDSSPDQAGERDGHEGTVFNHLTDLGNAARFALLHGSRVRYVAAFGRWYIWQGTHWREDATNEIERLARAVVADMHAEAALLGDDDDEVEQRRRKRLSAHAFRSEARARLEAMPALARAEAGIAIDPDVLDRDPWLLAAGNGTIDLRSGGVRPARPSELITRVTPVVCQREATCPRWLGFVDRIMDGDKDLIAFLQRALGYSLTGLTRERVAFFLYGTGANGKSTFLHVARHLLGEYAQTTRPQTLMRKRDESIPVDIAALRGARLVATSETVSGSHIDEALLKLLTGGDEVSARFLYGQPFSYTPTYKFWIATNHPPRISGDDAAVWTRVRLIPFDVSIPEDEQDHELAATLEAELPGILRWAIKGCLDWQQGGLKPPRRVLAATGQYRADMDVIGQFLDECCQAAPSAVTPSSVLYDAWVKWCGPNGVTAESSRSFGRRLSGRELGGVRLEATNSGHAKTPGWRGVALRNVETQTAAWKESA